MTDLKEFQHFEQRLLVRERTCSDEWPLLETLDFFEISHDSYQPLKFLPLLTLSTQYFIFLSLTGENLPEGAQSGLPLRFNFTLTSRWRILTMRA